MITLLLFFKMMYVLKGLLVSFIEVEVTFFRWFWFTY